MEASSSGASAEEVEHGDRKHLAAVVEIERLLDYTFQDRSLLVEALTHGSHADRPSYQRLEFFGDAVLGLAVTKFLFFTNPALDSGALTVLRSANLSTEKLARVAVRLRLYRFLRRNSPALDQMVSEFTDLVTTGDKEGYNELSFGKKNKARKVLADIVESIAAAVYVDSNFDLDIVWKVFMGILSPLITPENMNEHPVSVLYELYQKHGKRPDIEYTCEGSLFVAKVVVDGDVLGSGISTQKGMAKIDAARDVLRRLSETESRLSFVVGDGGGDDNCVD